MAAQPRSVFAPRPQAIYDRAALHDGSVVGCDVVIVGSGAGGAVAAAELAEAGYDVVVLEEGSHYTTEDFTASSSEMVRKLYRGGGATAALGSPHVLYQEGMTVGGSTVVNGGMSWRTPVKILERWSREAALDRVSAADMEPYFERVERRIHVAYQDEGSVGRDNELLRLGAEAKGWKVIPNRRNQLHCPGSNNCAFGCPTGAKQSVLVSYLPRALHFGARVYSNVRADRILFRGKRAVGVAASIRGEHGECVGNLTVRAHFVISACGSVHTPALLWRSGVRSPSGALGRNLSLHPNSKIVAIFDEEVRGWEGVHQAYQVREFEGEGFLFAAVNVPPGVIALSTAHYGAELGELMLDYKRMVVAGLLVEDTVTGSLRRVGGSAVPTYQLSAFDAERLVRGTALLSELLFEAGARRILPPFAGVGELRGPDDLRKLYSARIPKSSMEVLTVHLMGTAAMGGDPARFVCDSVGLVNDAERLMVADASLFPTPIGVNPMETIQALVTRNVHQLLTDRGDLLT